MARKVSLKNVYQLKPTSIKTLWELGQLTPKKSSFETICKKYKPIYRDYTGVSYVDPRIHQLFSYLGLSIDNTSWINPNLSMGATRWHTDDTTFIIMIAAKSSVGTIFRSMNGDAEVTAKPWHIYLAFDTEHKGPETNETRIMYRFFINPKERDRLAKNMKLGDLD